MTERGDPLDTSDARLDLHARTVSSGLFALTGRALGILLLLGTVAILARLLSPDDFGVIAMVLPVTILAGTLFGIGLPAALLHDEGLTTPHVSRLFWLAQLVNLAVAAVMAALGPAVAAFYDEPRVVAVTAIWAASLFARHTGAFHEALLKRQLRFGRVVALDLAGLAAGSAVAVFTATRGAGHLALILQIAVWDVIRAAGAWVICPWRPASPRGRPLPWSEVRGPVAYGTEFAGFRVLYWLGRQADRAVVGFVGGAASLGLYDIARRWAWYPFFQLFEALTEVAVSSLSRLRQDAQRFRAYCRQGMQPIVALPLPAITFIFVEAERVVLILLGPTWTDAIPYMRLMAAAAFFGSIARTTQWLYMSEGRTRRQLRWGFVMTPAMLAAVLIGARWGPQGVAWGFTLANAALVLPTVAYCLRGSILSARDFAGIVWRPVMASILAGVALVWIRDLLKLPAAPMPGLAPAALIFGTGYVALWLALPGGRRAMRELRTAVTAPFRAGSRG